MTSELRRSAKFRDQITPAFVRLIGISSALHDIGKVGIEDSILLKPGKLSSDERFRMQFHANIGGKCLKQIEQRLGNSNFLEMAQEIALHHHEHWDGSGYPAGISGKQIPLAARIVSIADVYDALSVRRVYKAPFPHEECVRIIREKSGKQFDPNLVEVFLTIESQFRDIARRFAETSNEAQASQNADGQEQKQQLTPAQEEALISALTMDEPASRCTELVATTI